MVRVICYSGGRGEELPRAVVWDDHLENIEMVVRQELVEDWESGERHRVFWCRVGGRTLKLTRQASGAWQVE